MDTAPGHRDASKTAAGSELEPSGAVGRRTPRKVVYQPPGQHVRRRPEHASREAFAVVDRLAACDTQVEAVGIVAVAIAVVQVHSLYPAVVHPAFLTHPPTNSKSGFALDTAVSLLGPVWTQLFHEVAGAR